MQLTINIKTSPFGQVHFGPVAPAHPLVEQKRSSQEDRPPVYIEPTTVGSKSLEIVYEQEVKNYVVPLTTG